MRLIFRTAKQEPAAPAVKAPQAKAPAVKDAPAQNLEKPIKYPPGLQRFDERIKYWRAHGDAIVQEVRKLFDFVNLFSLKELSDKINLNILKKPGNRDLLQAISIKHTNKKVKDIAAAVYRGLSSGARGGYGSRSQHSGLEETRDSTITKLENNEIYEYDETEKEANPGGYQYLGHSNLKIIFPDKHTIYMRFSSGKFTSSAFKGERDLTDQIINQIIEIFKSQQPKDIIKTELEPEEIEKGNALIVTLNDEIKEKLPKHTGMRYITKTAYITAVVEVLKSVVARVEYNVKTCKSETDKVAYAVYSQLLTSIAAAFPKTPVGPTKNRDKRQRIQLIEKSHNFTTDQCKRIEEQLEKFIYISKKEYSNFKQVASYIDKVIGKLQEKIDAIDAKEIKSKLKVDTMQLPYLVLAHLLNSINNCIHTGLERHDS